MSDTSLPVPFETTPAPLELTQADLDEFALWHPRLRDRVIRSEHDGLGPEGSFDRIRVWAPYGHAVATRSGPAAPLECSPRWTIERTTVGLIVADDIDGDTELHGPAATMDDAMALVVEIIEADTAALIAAIPMLRLPQIGPRWGA